VHETEDLLDDLGDGAREPRLQPDTRNVTRCARGLGLHDVADLTAGDVDVLDTGAQRMHGEIFAVLFEEDLKVAFGHGGLVDEGQDDEIHRAVLVDAGDRLAGGPEGIEVTGAALEVRQETDEGGGGGRGGTNRHACILVTGLKKRHKGEANIRNFTKRCNKTKIQGPRRCPGTLAGRRRLRSAAARMRRRPRSFYLLTSSSSRGS
jgi:hypothetical protein